MENLSYLRLNNSTPMPELLSTAELDKKYNFGIILNFSEDQIKKLAIYDPNYRRAMGLSPNVSKHEWRKKLDILHCLSYTKFLKKRKNIDLNTNVYDSINVFSPLSSAILNGIVNSIENKKYNKNKK